MLQNQCWCFNCISIASHHLVNHLVNLLTLLQGLEADLHLTNAQHGQITYWTQKRWNDRKIYAMTKLAHMFCGLVQFTTHK